MTTGLYRLPEGDAARLLQLTAAFQPGPHAMALEIVAKQQRRARPYGRQLGPRPTLQQRALWTPRPW
jgi:hypothetical protein